MGELPNILLVIVDDMGVHQLGCYGSSFYETPCIDRLAAEGARFATAYSASPVCSPARAALYTGLHPARLHLTNYIPGTEPANARLATPPWRAHLPVEVDTLGDRLQRQGYATGHFGKWHLAHDYNYAPGRPTDPESQGFASVVVTRKPLATADPEADPHHIDRLTEAALDFMRTPREGPFLCVVAHNALHRPELAPAALCAHYSAKPGVDQDSRRPVLAAMTSHVDQSVGRLLAALDRDGLRRNTVVAFVSDHGALGHSGVRKPLRGAKADLYEGGIRVPFILSLPGVIQPGDRGGVAFGTDLVPTLLELTGTGAAAEFDGVSLTRSLREGGAAGEGREELCWHFPHYHHLGLAPCGAIRVGPWKLVEWFDRTIGEAVDGPPWELFHLEEDPGETRDLSADYPDRCAALLQRLRAWRKRVGAQEMTPNPRFDPAAAVATAPPPPGDPVNPFGE
jgi:arylsulfatase A-like enzyme